MIMQRISLLVGSLQIFNSIDLHLPMTKNQSSVRLIMIVGEIFDTLKKDDLHQLLYIFVLSIGSYGPITPGSFANLPQR